MAPWHSPIMAPPRTRSPKSRELRAALRLLFYYPAVELPKIFKPSKYVILGGPGPITGERQIF
ncbi:hypothetical protein KXW00_006024 [Aspergillus fumigatus]|nr:hypothetical protein KXW00_006024 [Aspergillus fumigatus]